MFLNGIHCLNNFQIYFTLSRQIPNLYYFAIECKVNLLIPLFLSFRLDSEKSSKFEKSLNDEHVNRQF